MIDACRWLLAGYAVRLYGQLPQQNSSVVQRDINVLALTCRVAREDGLERAEHRQDGGEQTGSRDSQVRGLAGGEHQPAECLGGDLGAWMFRIRQRLGRTSTAKRQRRDNQRRVGG